MISSSATTQLSPRHLRPHPGAPASDSDAASTTPTTDSATSHQRRRTTATPILCRACHAVLAHERDLVDPDGGGIRRTFSNPAGVLFEILCVQHAQGVAPAGPATTDFSWFAGFAWRFAACAHCAAHVGWTYESTTATTGAAFVGLISRAIELGSGG